MAHAPQLCHAEDPPHQNGRAAGNSRLRGPQGPGDTCGPSGKGWMYLRGAVVGTHMFLLLGV